MFISIYFKTSSCDSDPEINTFIYGPPPSINFCARLLSMMDRLWLDTCKQSSMALSSSPPSPRLAASGFCVAVQWEVTGHSNPMLAASHHPTASPGPLLSCPPFPASSSGFHLPARLMTGSSMALIHDKQSPQPTADWEKHMQNKCTWPLALSWASILSMLPCLSHQFCLTYWRRCIISFL